ncbi:hypothetical protein K525DRAFT_249406 [Schizophyllum commune Loenen D]|nr:hypothetical protein K525DRAFT_249406 [Schizophyllum commune Loenen D]
MPGASSSAMMIALPTSTIVNAPPTAAIVNAPPTAAIVNAPPTSAMITAPPTSAVPRGLTPSVMDLEDVVTGRTARGEPLPDGDVGGDVECGGACWGCGLAGKRDSGGVWDYQGVSRMR